MPSPFPSGPVVRECLWKKTQIEKNVCSSKEMFLKILQISQENGCIVVCDFIKIRLQHWRFPVKFAKFLKNLFYRTSPMAASGLRVRLRINTGW